MTSDLGELWYFGGTTAASTIAVTQCFRNLLICEETSGDSAGGLLVRFLRRPFCKRRKSGRDRVLGKGISWRKLVIAFLGKNKELAMSTVQINRHPFKSVSDPLWCMRWPRTISWMLLLAHVHPPRSVPTAAI